MMNLYLYFNGTTRQEVVSYLSTFCRHSYEPSSVRPEGDRWQYGEGGLTELYIDLWSFKTLFEHEYDDEETQQVLRELGQEPDVVLAFDVSSNCRSDEVVVDFVKRMLALFQGVANDCVTYPSHLWTLAEIQSQALYHGHHFWDYRGWHEEGVQNQRQEAKERLDRAEAALPQVASALQSGFDTYEKLELWEEFSQNLVALSDFAAWAHILTPKQRTRYDRLHAQVQTWEPQLRAQHLKVPDMNTIFGQRPQH